MCATVCERSGGLCGASGGRCSNCHEPRCLVMTRITRDDESNECLPHRDKKHPAALDLKPRRPILSYRESKPTNWRAPKSARPPSDLRTNTAAETAQYISDSLASPSDDPRLKIESLKGISCDFSRKVTVVRDGACRAKDFHPRRANNEVTQDNRCNFGT